MITFTKTRDVKSPQRGTDGSAGLDFFIPNDSETIHLYPGESAKIPSGIKVMIPYGYAGIFFNKSGIGSKGVTVGACVVDSDYRGEVHLDVHNVTKDKIYAFKPGEKLVQMLIMPVDMGQPTECPTDLFDELYNNTKRGSGGFGSTGV